MSSYTGLGVHSPLINMDLIDMLDQRQVNPFAIMADMAVAAEDEAVRLSAAKELAQYLSPKKRSLDSKVDMKATTTYNVVNFSTVDPDAARALAQAVKDQMRDMPKSKAEVKMLMERAKDVTPTAVTVEAMRRDVDRLIVDQDGMQVE